MLKLCLQHKLRITVKKREWMKKIIFTCLFLVTTLIVTAQNNAKDLNINEIHTSYMQVLKLEKAAAKKFKKILIKYNKELFSAEKTENKSLYNKVLKKMDLEVYAICTPVQFDTYKKLKLELEPSKKYRW